MGAVKDKIIEFCEAVYPPNERGDNFHDLLDAMSSGLVGDSLPSDVDDPITEFRRIWEEDGIPPHVTLEEIVEWLKKKYIVVSQYNSCGSVGYDVVIAKSEYEAKEIIGDIREDAAPIDAWRLEQWFNFGCEVAEESKEQTMEWLNKIRTKEKA